MNVLMGRPANKSTSLPPLTSGSDQGRQREREREREDVSYWLAQCSFPGVDRGITLQDRPLDLIPPWSKTK